MKNRWGVDVLNNINWGPCKGHSLETVATKEIQWGLVWVSASYPTYIFAHMIHQKYLLAKTAKRRAVVTKSASSTLAVGPPSSCRTVMVLWFSLSAFHITTSWSALGFKELMLQVQAPVQKRRTKYPRILCVQRGDITLGNDTRPFSFGSLPCCSSRPHVLLQH